MHIDSSTSKDNAPKIINKFWEVTRHLTTYNQRKLSWQNFRVTDHCPWSVFTSWRQPFIHSFIQSFIHSFISFIHSFIHPFHFIPFHFMSCHFMSFHFIQFSWVLFSSLHFIHSLFHWLIHSWTSFLYVIRSIVHWFFHVTDFICFHVMSLASQKPGYNSLHLRTSIFH
jgi:hypothetical protein